MDACPAGKEVHSEHPNIGPREGGGGNSKQIKILNRVVSRHDKEGLSYEADPRHVEILFKQLQLTDTKPVATPRN